MLRKSEIGNRRTARFERKDRYSPRQIVKRFSFPAERFDAAHAASKRARLEGIGAKRRQIYLIDTESFRASENRSEIERRAYIFGIHAHTRIKIALLDDAVFIERQSVRRYNQIPFCRQRSDDCKEMVARTVAYAPLVEGLGIDKRTKFRGGGFGQRRIAQHDLRKALSICRPRHRRKIVRSAFFRNTRDIAFECSERKRKFPPALPSFKLKQFSRLNHSASANAGGSVHRFDKIEQIIR